MGAARKDSRWGMPIRVWEAAKQELQAQLVARASTRRTMSYSDACEAIRIARFRPYSWALMALLDEVCAEEEAATGLVLATLVVRKDTGLPGEGYFRWAGRSGADIVDRQAFWREQAEAVWTAYGSATADGEA